MRTLTARPTLRVPLALLALALAALACNLSAAPPEPEPLPLDPPAQITPLIPATQTPRPTSTPAPTATATRAAPGNTGGTGSTGNNNAVYSVRQPVPAPACGVIANSVAVNVRNGGGTNYSIVGVLPTNNWLRATRVDVNGWYQVSAPGTPVDFGWISGGFVTLQQPCACTGSACSATVVTPAQPPGRATATQPPPPGVCSLSSISGDVPVLRQPNGGSEVWGVLGNDTYAVLAGRTANGWYAFDPAALQAPNVGVWRLRWVRSDAGVETHGDCSTLPWIDYDYVYPPGDCRFSPAKGVGEITLYAQPSYEAGVWGSLFEGEAVRGIGYTEDGQWYAVEPSGTETDIGLYRLRFIPIDQPVVGDGCDSLPGISIDGM
jgi:hypothetical protein